MICYTCKEDKDNSQFAVKNKEKGTYNKICKSCKNDYNQKWYQDNKLEHKNRVKNNNRQYRKKLREFLNKIKNVPCKDCGGRFPPVCMDFDHLDSSKKELKIGSLVSSPTEEMLLAEIVKCEIVCSNCHRIRTFNRKQYNPKWCNNPA